MLTHINVRNLAIVDEIDVELTAGMTALTGETGAGKSILVDALGLVPVSYTHLRAHETNDLISYAVFCV